MLCFASETGVDYYILDVATHSYTYKECGSVSIVCLAPENVVYRGFQLIA